MKTIREKCEDGVNDRVIAVDDAGYVMSVSETLAYVPRKYEPLDSTEEIIDVYGPLLDSDDVETLNARRDN